MCSLHTQQYEQLPRAPQPWNTHDVGSNSHCNSLHLQSSQTRARTPAVQSCQSSSAPNIPAAKLSQQPCCWKAGHILGGSAKCYCSNIEIQSLQFRASRDASHQAQTYTRMRLVLPCGAASHTQEVLHKLLDLHWDGNPLQHQNTN